MASKLEAAFALQIRAAGLPKPVAEFRFHTERRWRFDAAWPDVMLAVEIEGGHWQRGRHTRPKGFAADLEKYNAAARMGWMVLRFTGDDVRNGRALAGITEALAVATDSLPLRTWETTSESLACMRCKKCWVKAVL